MDKIILGKKPVERITYPDDAPPPIRFAAEELQTYLKESLNVEIDVEKGVPAKGAFFISTSELNPEVAADAGPFEEGKYDRCIVSCQDDCVFMIGENPMSALYAVYDFLQDRLNIRFFAPGREHEYIPTHSALHLENGFVLRTGSRFVIRDYVTNNPETLSFAVKNRVNTIKWEGLNCDAKNLETIRAHGVKLRGPGHIWSLFVPDESLFEKHPEYFPMIDGRRTVNNRTACFSNPEARRIFIQKLRNYLRKNPYWDIFAFWAEDIKDPYYCGCPKCTDMEIPDWYITLVNEAARVVEEGLPHAVFEFIAYHGTRFTPKQVKKLYRNGENMLFNFCIGYTRDLYNPFEKKTYGSAEVFEMYQNWRNYLSDVGFKGQIMIMDYYNLCEEPNQGPRGRALLWPMEVIREDVRFYLKEGIDGVGDWICLDRLCWPSPFNVWCWLQLWKNPDTTVEALKDDFYPKYFGEVGDDVRKYMDELEAAMHQRTSPENIEQVKALTQMLDSIQPSQRNDQLVHRLKLVRIHHEYCVLLKEIFQAFSENAPEKWQALEKPYMTFFEETHRSDLEGHIDIPPEWAYTWFTWKLKKGEHLKMTKDLMLR